jgi:hypothetical protein
MIDLNVPNIVTIALISVGAMALFTMGMAKFNPKSGN